MFVFAQICFTKLTAMFSFGRTTYSINNARRPLLLSAVLCWLESLIPPSVAGGLSTGGCFLSMHGVLTHSCLISLSPKENKREEETGFCAKLNFEI